MKKTIDIIECDGCGEVSNGDYRTCLICQKTFNLKCKCMFTKMARVQIAFQGMKHQTEDARYESVSGIVARQDICHECFTNKLTEMVAVVEPHMKAAFKEVAEILGMENDPIEIPDDQAVVPEGKAGDASEREARRVMHNILKRCGDMKFICYVCRRLIHTPEEATTHEGVFRHIECPEALIKPIRPLPIGADRQAVEWIEDVVQYIQLCMDYIELKERT